MNLIEQAVQDCYLCGALKGDPMIPACGVKTCPMRGPKIVTTDQYFGWIAHLDNYNGPESPTGIGNTEQQAIDNLKEILADREEK